MVRFFCFFVTGLLLVLVIAVILPVQKIRLYPQFRSYQILDRNGTVLREVLSQDHKTSTWVKLEDIAPDLIAATILREDKRFLMHNGIDILSMLRALYTNMKAGKIMSGGSTITMQVAKMASSHKSRGVWIKIIEIFYAAKLELYLSKSEILEVYLNRAPYGNLNYGIQAAANFYYAKKAKQLSLGESCVLASIPKSPSVLNPYTNSAQVLIEKERLVKEFLETRLKDSTTCSIAINESLHVMAKEINFKAPHFVDFIITRAIPAEHSQITSTIDMNLQENVEKMLFTSISSLRGYNVNQGAVVVLDTKTGEILSMVGSRDYFDAKEGQVNGATAERQPGSSIKPFLYVLALESGIPLSYIINDTISEFRLSDGTVFAPRNYGNRYHGQSRIREALASSFNIPTVSILEKVGIQRFYDFLKRLRFKGLREGAHYYGLSLALGAAEADLVELTNAYRTLANKGIWTEARFLLMQAEPMDNNTRDTLLELKGEMLFSREIAFMVTDILSTNASRIKAFGMDSPLYLPFACAAKTGTSKNFRDNWCIGYTRKYTVGVWVGNFDGAPMHGVSGISGAAPLFRDIMIELHKNAPPQEFDEPPSLLRLVICSRTGKIASEDCPGRIEELFIKGTEPADTCRLERNYAGRSQRKTDIAESNVKITIANPRDGDIFKIDPQIPLVNQRITFKVNADTFITAVVLKLDGEPVLTKASMPYEFAWEPKPGIHRFTVIGIDDQRAYEETISFRVY